MEDRVLHDWIIIEPEKSTGILKMSSGEINTGIIKDFGMGFYADMGHYVDINNGLQVGSKILFTQHLSYDVDGEKVYCVRGRDVIKVYGINNKT